LPSVLLGNMKVLMTPHGLSDCLVDSLTSQLIMSHFLADKQHVKVVWCNDGKDVSSQAAAAPMSAKAIQQHTTSFERLWYYTNRKRLQRSNDNTAVTVTFVQISFWDDDADFEAKLCDCDLFFMAGSPLPLPPPHPPWHTAATQVRMPQKNATSPCRLRGKNPPL
jgi:hypothetical protein